MSKYDVRGLYIGSHTVEAETEDAARSQFHAEHPGWAGAILSVKEMPEDDG